MSTPNQKDIDAQAAQWLARLGGAPLSAGERADFEDWIYADEAHRLAFEEAQAAWASLGALSADPGPLRKVVRPRRKAGKASAGIGLVLALLLARHQLGDPWIWWQADFTTGPGEIRMVNLPDGSTVHLGPDSAIALHFGDIERRVELLDGEAFFEARPKEGAEMRPFVVDADGGRVTALGTKFSVGRLDGEVDVVSVEHEIGVTLASDSQPFGRVVMTPGHQVRYAKERGIGGVEAVDVEQRLAWRDGVLVFDTVPLAEVVERLNRYRRGRIVIANAKLAKRQVSGVFQTKNLADVVGTITTELGARAVSVPPFVTVLY